MLRHATTIVSFAFIGLMSQVFPETASAQQAVPAPSTGRFSTAIQRQPGADRVAANPNSRVTETRAEFGTTASGVRRDDLKAMPHPKFSSPALPAKPDVPRPSSSSRTSAAPSQSGVGSVWKTTLALGFIVALILVLAKFLKHRGPASILGLPAEAIEILGKRPIDRQQVIHLIRCGSRILVVGSAPNGLNTLAEITDPLEVDLLSGICRRQERSPNMVQAFATLFQKHSAANPDGHVKTPQQPRPSSGIEDFAQPTSRQLEEAPV